MIMQMYIRRSWHWSDYFVDTALVFKVVLTYIYLHIQTKLLHSYAMHNINLPISYDLHLNLFTLVQYRMISMAMTRIGT